MTGTGTVAVDFDGVIHAYRSGWQNGAIYDDPVPGAFTSLRLLMKTYAVYIHSTRSPASIGRWVKLHSGIETVWYEDESALPEFWNTQDCILVTRRKLPALAYIDDRAIRFTRWDQVLRELGKVLI